MSNAYIFYGKAGSGKGTQAKLLQDHLKSIGKEILLVETGAKFRAFMDGDSFIQKKAKETINSGKLMPAFMPVYIWSQALVEGFTGEQEVLLDGVTRRLDEAPVLDSALEYLGFEKVFIIHIHISDETALDRMKSRAAIDQEKGTSRSDDQTIEAMQKRLDAYKNQVMPVIEYFRNHAIYQVLEINGEETPEGVFAQIQEVVK